MLEGARRIVALVGSASLLALGAATPALPAGELKPWAGGPPPRLILQDLDGRTHRLGDYRGSVVLINFWATWCGPCREEMPSLQRLKGKLAGTRFSVLAVNLDEPESRIRKFLSQAGVDFTVLLDPEKKAAKAWSARVLPASFVIGPDGRVRYSVVGDIEWDREPAVRLITEMLPPGSERREQ